jgi:hypothetical protein
VTVASVPEQVEQIQDLLSETNRVYSNLDVYHETNKQLGQLTDKVQDIMPSDKTSYYGYKPAAFLRVWLAVEDAVRALQSEIYDARMSEARWEACRA